METLMLSDDSKRWRSNSGEVASMGSHGSRVARLEGPSTAYVSVGDIDRHLDELMAANPCMADHHAPPHLDNEAELRWIDAMLTDHEKNGPCESRNGPDWNNYK
jgi:hypothetical protein